jgi:cytochrome c oxidase subunit 2
MAIVAALACAFCGCGAGAAPSATGTSSDPVPAYVTEPFTHEQRLIEQGAPLIVADGCAACHLLASAARGLAPSFSSFAGHRVRLADGRSVLVDERFVREGLLHPRANELAGYDPAPMLAALARLHLDEQPRQVQALAAFIEQVGPEPE